MWTHGIFTLGTVHMSSHGGMDKLRGALGGMLQDSDSEQTQQSTPTEVKFRNTVGRAKSNQKRHPLNKFIYTKFEGRQKWIVLFRGTYRGGKYHKKSRNESHKYQDTGCLWGGARGAVVDKGHLGHFWGAGNVCSLIWVLYNSSFKST